MKISAKKNILFFMCALYLLTFSVLTAENNTVPDYILKSLFNDNLKTEESASIAKGEIVVRNIGNYKKICLNDVSDKAAEILVCYKKLKPAYLAETILIRPVKSNTSDEIKKLDDALADVSNYVGIPYYSVRNKQWYDLYSSAEVKNRFFKGNTECINVDFEMEPFGSINTDITIENSAQSLFYTSINTSKIKYSGFTCIDSGELISYIYVFQYGEWQIIYGIGGADAPSIFFLQDRIETSFVNRITTFCTFMCQFLK
ncbi:MAG: hypothetical protein K5751_02875 [Treponemataceae bacterium]|nr:hypothetical protein [Treponemataceae bacterium]